MSCCPDCEYEDGKGEHDDCGNPQCPCHVEELIAAPRVYRESGWTAFKRMFGLHY